MVLKAYVHVFFNNIYLIFSVFLGIFIDTLSFIIHLKQKH